MIKFNSWLSKEFFETKLLLKNIPASTMTLFVLSIVAMNLLANKCIVSLPWLALDAGMLISWLSFLSMDMIVKRFGPKASIKVSLIATGINLSLSCILLIASIIPGVWGASYVNGSQDIINAALDTTIGGTWYVLFGSTVAFIVSAIINTVINWSIGKLYIHKTFKAYALRSYVSTAIGQFVDNFVFSLIVSINFFGWTIVQCIMCAITGAIVELMFEIVFSPIGFSVANNWEKSGVGNEYVEMVGSDK